MEVRSPDQNADGAEPLLEDGRRSNKAFAKTLREAVAAKDLYVQIATPDKGQQEIVARVAAADELFQRRLVIAQT